MAAGYAVYESEGEDVGVGEDDWLT